MDGDGQLRLWGYHIVTINNASENAFVFSGLGGSGERWHIGLRDRDRSATYEDHEWEEGTSGYRNWDSAGWMVDQCVTIDGDNDGHWHDHGCHDDREYICEAGPP